MINHLKTTSITSVAVLLITAAHAETEIYDFSGFSRVSASEGVDVEVTVGGDFSVRAEGDAEDIERLEIKKRGEKLKIGRNSGIFNMRWSRGRSPVVYVTLPALNEAESSSGAEMDARGVNADDFSASASSGSELQLEGQCGRLRASASTGAELDAEGLKCRDVDVSVSTGADVSVYASESVDASASTGGDIDVSGAPQQRDVSKSLGGDVDIR